MTDDKTEKKETLTRLGETITRMRGWHRQEVFAEKIGMTQSNLSKLECGKLDVRVSTLIRIISKLDKQTDAESGNQTQKKTSR